MRIRLLLSIFSLTSAAALSLAGGAWAQEAAKAETEIPAGWEDLLRNPKMPREGVVSGGQPTDEQLEAL